MALEIDDAFWNAAPSKRTAEMLEALRMAYKKADEAESVWRKKMVNQLLPVAIMPPRDAIGRASNDVSTNAHEQHSSDANSNQQVAQESPAQNVASASDRPAPRTKAQADRGWVMKRAALIKKHEGYWKSINRDFQDASENGLSKAAKATGHGDWFETDALNWARQRNKLIEKTDLQVPIPATPFTGLTHRIQG
jgi:hypothetical protein